MNKIIRNVLASFFTVSILFACTKQQDNSVGVTTDPQVTTGNWKIILYTEPSEDKTHDFSGDSFTFSTNGKLSVSNGVTSTDGTWSINHTRFIINLGIKSPSNKLGDLTHEWVIVSKTDSLISLKDDSSTSDEVLQFAKN